MLSLIKIISAGVLLGAPTALATVSSISISGASHVTTSNNVVYVYGGLGGDEANCDSTDATSTCDSCSGVTGIAVCNENRIHSNLMLRVQFKTDSSAVITASSKLEIQINGATSNIDVDTDYSSDSLAINTALTAAISWTDLCLAMGMTGGCTEDQTTPVSVKFGINADSDAEIEEGVEVKIQVTGQTMNDAPGDYLYHTPNCATDGVDASRYEGFCDFTVFKGDKKVYIEDETSDDSYSSTGLGTTYKNVRFYYEADTDTTCDDTEFQNVTVNSDYFDLEATEENDSYFLKTRSLKGLTNDIGYYFRMANVDIAGNIFYFSPDVSVGLAGQYLTCTDNRHYAVPEPVVGLLEEKSCFIATAAFGSSLAPQLDTLREFRNKFLLTHPTGRWLVKKYYEFSPDLAQWIKQHHLAKQVTRSILWPIVALTSLANGLGLTVTLMLFSIFALALGFAIYSLKRSKHETN